MVALGGCDGLMAASGELLRGARHFSVVSFPASLPGRRFVAGESEGLAQGQSSYAVIVILTANIYWALHKRRMHHLIYSSQRLSLHFRFEERLHREAKHLACAAQLQRPYH